MPDHDNDSDKLESFFKKAASHPEIVFNEDDWKKLEARLNAASPQLPVVNHIASKISAAMAIIVLFVGSIYWNVDATEEAKEGFSFDQGQSSGTQEQSLSKMKDLNDNTIADIIRQPTVSETDRIQEEESQALGNIKFEKDNDPSTTLTPSNAALKSLEEKTGKDGDIRNTVQGEDFAEGQGLSKPSQAEYTDLPNSGAERLAGSLVTIHKNKLHRELILLSPARADKIKQKAGSQLPGAEEADSRKVEAIVEEEDASPENTALASPRLSLLLSLAPDFSSTSLGEYTTPGGAYGAMIHYHIKNAWSVSAGLVKNRKKYTGDGEEYQPPKGYWKYYTNGVIPESIDGSCSILEIPIMLQYTLIQSGRSRFLLGAGASSYMMLNESYQYTFQEPNPGAKEGWHSKKGSRFFFNMINFAVGFEHQIAPGLHIGVEPYLKIPIEEIGWSNLKLFSTGASFTLRYQILNKNKAPLVITRSRSPD